MPFQVVSNQLNSPQVDFSQGGETLENDQEVWETPELSLKCHSKGSEYNRILNFFFNLFPLCL